jgi:hypothetical protein
MHDVPLTGPAFAVQGLQGGHAMHIVHSAIPAFRQALKGVSLQRLLAPAASVCHRFILINIAVTKIRSIPPGLSAVTDQA